MHKLEECYHRCALTQVDRPGRWPATQAWASSQCLDSGVLEACCGGRSSVHFDALQSSASYLPSSEERRARAGVPAGVVAGVVAAELSDMATAWTVSATAAVSPKAS